MQPLVLVEGDYSASLDGLTFEGDLLLEIKCPVKGQESVLWQLEHQFLVSKAQTGHLYVFDGADGILLEVTPCPERCRQSMRPGMASCGASRRIRHRR